VFAVPHSPVVFAGRAVQSALAQQPAVGMHRFVPGQFLKPVLQVMPQVPLVHTALPFDVGTVQALQPAPQKVVLVSDWHTLLQLCVPVGQVPLQAIALAMQAPLHSLLLLGHAGTHARPSHVTEPPPDGVWHAVHDVGPQVATARLLTHLPAQT
jgi:hypothetical protein